MKNEPRMSFLKSFQRALLEHPWLGPVLSGVLAALAINLLTETLTAMGGTTLGWVVTLLLAVAVVGFVYANDASHHRWLRSLGPIRDIPQPAAYKGLIFLFSNEKTLRAAVEHHASALQFCWLITTPEMQAAAGACIGDFPQVRFSILPVSNLYNTQACYEVVRHIYQSGTRDIGLAPDQVIADITGGTKPMTMGMIVACLEGGFPIEHVPTQYDLTGKPLGALPPIEMRLSRS